MTLVDLVCYIFLALLLVVGTLGTILNLMDKEKTDE